MLFAFLLLLNIKRKSKKKIHSMLALAIGIQTMVAYMKDATSMSMVKTMEDTLEAWLLEMEKTNSGQASQLELGKDWLDVASKLCKDA